MSDSSSSPPTVHLSPPPSCTPPFDDASLAPMVFTKAALTRHWDRMVANVAEWRGVWTRYQMASDGRLIGAPSFSGVCALKKGGCASRGAGEPPVIEQSNTLYEAGADVEPRVVIVPPLTLDSFAAFPTERNSVILFPDESVLVWSTLDFNTVTQPPTKGGIPRMAAVELACRFRSSRARVVFVYGAEDSDAGGPPRWRLEKFTSIRDTCQAGPHDAPSAPAAGTAPFWQGQPATADGWIWEVHEVAVGGAAWQAELTEVRSSGSLDAPLAAHLDYAAARPDVPEPDLLIHAPDELIFAGDAAVTFIAMTWSPERNVCLRAAVAINGSGKLQSVRSSHWKHLHWMAAT